MNATSTTSKKAGPVIPLKAFTGEIELQSPDIGINDNIYRQKFTQSILDQQKDYPAPVPVLSIHQADEAIPLLTLKSFSLWQGKQKSKKTTALALAVASIISDKIDCLFKCITRGKVLFFDNEQGESYAARTMKLILKIAGVESSPDLVYCDLREFSPADRMKIIRAGIESTDDVVLVVIDGLVDLLTDFMDAGEGHSTTTELLRLCSEFNIHIAGVLHQNKGDKNARAHIGSISSQKCEVEVSTEVDPDDRNQSIVSCINSRGIAFESFAIRWDKGSLPCINQDWNNTQVSGAKAGRAYDKSKDIAQLVFKPLASLTHTEAIASIMNTALKSESTAKRLLKDLQMWEIILKGDDGRYRINANKGSRVHEGSKEGS